MSQKTALMIASVLTAFVLVVGGAVVGRLTQTPSITAEASQDPLASPDVQVFLDREAAYQDLIQQANDRLAQAYSKNQAQATTPAYPVTPEQATQIALQVAPGSVLLTPPQLVNFQGSMAYEVSLNLGMVYIDANTGQVLYNGAVYVAQWEGSDGGGAPSEHNGLQRRGGSEGGHGGEQEGGDD